MFKSVSTIVNQYHFYCSMKALKRHNPYRVKVIIVQSTTDPGKVSGTRDQEAHNLSELFPSVCPHLGGCVLQGVFALTPSMLKGAKVSEK